MRFGYILPNFGNKIGAHELLEIAQVCEDEGFDSVWATDHIIMPTKLKEPYGQVLEPLVTLSHISSRTRKLRLGTSILVLPQRNPILVAKQAATLDVFSGGRTILGFGAGWAEKEFGFLNADFHRRGKVFDESIRLIRALWKEDVVDFRGKFFRVRGAHFLPKPTKGTIPIWIGGNGTPSLKRVARLGDGWHPIGLPLEQFRKEVRELRRLKKGATVSIRMTTDVRKKRDTYTSASGEKRVAVSGSGAEIRKAVDAYVKAGLDYYCASILHPSASDIVADLRRFAAEVVRSY